MKIKIKNKKETANISEPTELLEIPKYIGLQQRKKCDKCKHKYNCHMDCTRSKTGAKIYCKKFAKQYYTMQTIIFIIIQVLGIWGICSKSSDLWLEIGASLIYTAILFVFDILASKLAEIFSENIEIERKQRYDKKVSEIKQINEQVERRKKGETEEYSSFINRIQDVVKKLNADARIINSMYFEDKEFENDKVGKRFNELIKRLESLNQKITPQNYDSDSVQAFYRIHLETFLEKTQNYITLYNEKKLTPNQLTKFEELLQMVIKKIDSYIEYFLKIEEEKFIADLQSFKETMIEEENEEKESKE